MEKIKFITVEELLEMDANGEKFKIVEALSEESYNEAHIPGAVNIPGDKVEELAPKLLEKDDTIVVYCSSYQCEASTSVAKKLLEMGYSKTVDFKAGKKGWVHAGFALEEPGKTE